MRWLRRIVFTLLSILLLAFAAGWLLLAGSRARLDGTQVQAGLFDLSKQYLIAGNARGREIRMGDNMKTSIAESPLPVRSAKEPRPLTA